MQPRPLKRNELRQMTLSLLMALVKKKKTVLHISTTMESLCEQLDSALLEYFDTLEQFYQCQATLEQTLKAGNLHMSRARYIRGTVSISQCKITEKEMQASVHVSVSNETTPTSAGKDKIEPTFVLMTSESENLKQPSSDAPRRRQKDTENEDTSQTEVVTDENKTECGTLSKDPLHWFGVLVPQALRYSQKNYKSAVEQCVELANLQSRIQQIQTTYKNLLHKKNLLAFDKLKIF